MKRDMDLVRQILLDLEEGQSSFQTDVVEAGSDQEFEEIGKTRRHLDIMTAAGLIETVPDAIDK